MRSTFILMFTCLLPFAALAQSHSNAPMVVVGEGSPVPSQAAPAAAPAQARAPAAPFPNFPEIAITRVGENTTGQHVDTPQSPATPASPPAVAAGATPVTPTNPASPPAPKSPVSKLWPRDTIEIFLPPCTGLRPQFVVPCTCVITKLMVEMPHDEFLAKSEAGTIEQDPRLQRIRRDCATAPQKKE